jgi:tetratricopeptide (TPR) repeat protein
LVAEFPNVTYHHQLLAAICANLAARFQSSGRAQEAEKTWLQNIDICEKLPLEARSMPACRENLTESYNHLAWLLTNDPDGKMKVARAIELAKKAIALSPKRGRHWNTLGVAYYRAGDWKAAKAALERSLELPDLEPVYDWLFLAMTEWRLGHKEEARKWRDRSVRWLHEHQPKNEEVRRFQVEAGELLGVQAESKPIR